MELVAGQPYWLIKSGLPYHYPKLLKNAKCQVLIIGGGISGAITAYMLTIAGFECMLVDARSIGLGSTCASTSLLQYELDIPLHRLKKKVGEQKAIRAYQLCGEAVDKLIDLMTDIGVRQFDSRPSLYFSQHASQRQLMKKEYLARKQAGFKVEMLDHGQLESSFNLTAAVGILSAKGATNNAYGLTHALLQHCVQKGSNVLERTKITTIRYESDRVILKT
ncbi:MAG TPA: FAD-dependent oxidoreductase, partial [Chitinophagaceae bacterium]|nr:FAD-dependent oxidoreductase [Chitinophagaceae bacterium]